MNPSFPRKLDPVFPSSHAASAFLCCMTKPSQTSTLPSSSCFVDGIMEVRCRSRGRRKVRRKRQKVKWDICTIDRIGKAVWISGIGQNYAGWSLGCVLVREYIRSYVFLDAGKLSHHQKPRSGPILPFGFSLCHLGHFRLYECSSSVSCVYKVCIALDLSSAPPFPYLLYKHKRT